MEVIEGFKRDFMENYGYFKTVSNLLKVQIKVCNRRKDLEFK